ncbi:unnamed protein product [Caenorhabditis bovis]|uniref:UBC core domain-containing protein n=1 Tax=Caenorhabditis bovis TaxID=2654633 RepID=A0A8S1EV25_9PELO|nr:unnamed protein product [Caenorhabditis bovis]
MADYERVVLVKPKVFVYKLPPLGTGGHKAATWDLDNPAWTGRLRLISVGKKIELRLEDGETGALYAKCPVDSHPGVAIDAVSDSSRYFVIRLQNDNGQTAFVGCGFQERSDAFDFNVALQDHFKYIERSEQFEKLDSTPGPSLDLAFKEGQTISISIGKKDGAAPSRPRAAPVNNGGVVPLLPPPPGAGSIIRNTKPTAAPVQSQQPTLSSQSVATVAATRRLQKDYAKLAQDPIDGIVALPNESNILEWHYCLRGSEGTVYEDGYYWGKILFKSDFPWSPPSILMITPNGRFQTNTRLCLSISDYHPESWNPGWTVSAILVGLHSFMNENTRAAGTIDMDSENRRRLALASKEYNMKVPEFVTFFPKLVEEWKLAGVTPSVSTSNLPPIPAIPETPLGLPMYPGYAAAAYQMYRMPRFDYGQLYQGNQQNHDLANATLNNMMNIFANEDAANGAGNAPVANGGFPNRAALLPPSPNRFALPPPLPIGVAAPNVTRSGTLNPVPPQVPGTNSSRVQRPPKRNYDETTVNINNEPEPPKRSRDSCSNNKNSSKSEDVKTVVE